MELPRDSNQALGIGEYAIRFMAEGDPSQKVRARTLRFHTDAVLCGQSALAEGTNAPSILRDEALEYPDADGATLLDRPGRVKAEKAIVANSSAVREWDSNGTNFGYRPERGWTAGEFGHNDFYPVAVAACQELGMDGATALKAMVLQDEIRGRLSEVFSLKSYKIDHVVHGAIASATAYGALHGATAEQIESGIGLFVAHHIPWRAIRAGKQLSDSKGASAAISTEASVLGMKRALRGFVGPRDIFRNPESMFRQFQPTEGSSPFDLALSMDGDDFAIMGMHLKLGLYEHQSAGAIHGLLKLLANHAEVARADDVAHITIRAYEPAFGIIGDPAKRDPKTRQSADHSMVYIVATLLRKVFELGSERPAELELLWRATMLMPVDYSEGAIFDTLTRSLMEKISFEHGGPDYDARYPDGIPTSVIVETNAGQRLDSGLVMYPVGHARNLEADLDAMLATKWLALGALCDGDIEARLEKLNELPNLDAEGLMRLYGA
ncbi:bifunctional 2-methylcitrate dehydratase/aconitate hydratase [soil metagenome]